MAHFIDKYADRVNDILHGLIGTLFFKQEIIEVPGLLTGLLVTYDGVRDDMRVTHDKLSWEEFLDRMSSVKADWMHFDRGVMEQLRTKPETLLGGWEGRTIYFIRGGAHPQYWTLAHAEKDAILLYTGSVSAWGPIIQYEANHLREIVPVGREYFREYEHQVRVFFRFLFLGELGEGQAQSRTDSENEGVEIRDLVFANKAHIGFWKDLKDKYSASEIVIDAKNTDELTRDDLRQLYCYLKPALGFWGFIVCRSQPSERIHAFNRTLYKNFSQNRGMLILCDDDLRRMVEMRLRGRNPSEYLQEIMSTFSRKI